MARRPRPTTYQERVAITERASAGESDTTIAAALACSIWTVRKWRRIGKKQGRLGLSPRMGRPPAGPLSSLPAELRDTILQLRTAHPGWGPTTILAELRQHPLWRDYPLPSRARLAAFFRAHKVARRYQRHSSLPEPPAPLERHPHDEWELDAQGVVQVEGVGRVSLITIVDVISRLKIESYPCLDTSNPACEAYQLTLRRAFLSFGLPRSLSLDHGTVFFDNTTPSPFPTRLHLWLLGLGIVVRFTRVRQPTDHAKIERTHQTMTLQALLGQAWSDPVALWAGLDARRTMLNEHIPSRVLGQQAPLERYPEARQSNRPYRPEWEAGLFDEALVFSYLGTCRWFRQIKQNGVFAMGGYIYYVGGKYGGRAIEVTFDVEQHCFRGLIAGIAEPVAIAPQGLTKEVLMGDLAHLLALPAYQLALPFGLDTWRSGAYAHLLASTTL
jgi:transposase InsO family protein